MSPRSLLPLLVTLLLPLPVLADSVAEGMQAAAKEHGAGVVRVLATTTVSIERLPGLTRGTRRTHQVSVGGLVVDDEGLVLLPGQALDPAAASYALLGTSARAEVVRVRVVGQDGKIREAQWLGQDPKTRIAAVRVKPVGRAGLKPIAFGGGTAKLGAPLLVVSLTRAALGNTVRVERVRVSFVGDSALGITPQLPQGIGGLVLGAGNAPLGILGHLPLSTPRGDMLRPDLLAVARAGYVLPAKVLEAIKANPPKEASQPKARRARPWLGIRPQIVTPELAASLKLDVDIGVRIAELYEGPCKAAGLAVGDIFLRMDGEPLDLDPGESFEDLVEDYPLGVKITFLVRRKNKTKTVELGLARSPTRPEDAERVRLDAVGLTLRALTFFDRAGTSLDPKAPGAVVIALQPDGAGSRAGLQTGDVLLTADGEPIQSLADLQRRLETPGEHPLGLLRKGEKLTLRVRR